MGQKNYHTLSDAMNPGTLDSVAREVGILPMVLTQILTTMQVPPIALAAINYQMLVSCYTNDDDNLARAILKMAFKDRAILAFYPGSRDVAIVPTCEAITKILWGGNEVSAVVDGRNVRLESVPGKVFEVAGGQSNASSGSDSDRKLSPLALHLYSFLNAKWFDENDIKDLCFRLGVDWDDLSGNNKSTKAQSFLRYCDKSDMTQGLQSLMVSERPNLRSQIMSV